MTLVETFEVQEVAECQASETDAEALALVEKLGLEGQRRLVSEKEDGARTRSPYRRMTNRERFTYKLLCPKSTSAEEYSAEPIPLRVLQVLAHAKELGIFTGFQIWHEAVVQDPVLVAYVGSEYSGEFYILARWGEELETFEVLVERATRRAADLFRKAVARIKAQLDADHAAVEAGIDPDSGTFSEPSYYSNLRRA